MTKPTTLVGEIEAIRDAYAALNRNDIDGFVSLFAPDIERIEMLGFPQPGTYRGIEAVRSHVIKGRETWAEGGCEPQRFIVAGDRIVVVVHVRVRLKDEPEWREGDVWDAYAFRDGKATHFHSFISEAEAFEWAGVNTSDRH